VQDSTPLGVASLRYVVIVFMARLRPRISHSFAFGCSHNACLPVHLRLRVSARRAHLGGPYSDNGCYARNGGLQVARSKPLAPPCSMTTWHVHHAYKLLLWCTSCSSHQDRLGRGCNGGADSVQRGPDRISVLESRGLLEGLVGEVSAKYGRQNSCNSFVVLYVAYVLFTSRLGVGMRWC
jgi:hypothetical protein